jgi:hypothetical protein
MHGFSRHDASSYDAKRGSRKLECKDPSLRGSQGKGGSEKAAFSEHSRGKGKKGEVNRRKLENKLLTNKGARGRCKTPLFS